MSTSAQTPQPQGSGAPAEPTPPTEDVDALLASSLRARTEDDFTWREPERSPRWWERAEMRRAEMQRSEMGRTEDSEAADRNPVKRAEADQQSGVRIGAVVWSLIAMTLAGWVIAAAGFGLALDPLVLLLVVCATAGILLVVSGLLPRSGRRGNRHRRRRRRL